jgi:hypothetical protein
MDDEMLHNIEETRRKYLLHFAKKHCNILFQRADNIFSKLFGTQLPIEETKLSQTMPHFIWQKPTKLYREQPFHKDVIIMTF